MSSPTSLRERSKARRRSAIQRAAIRLFTEQGYDGTTVADIAEQAEVAPRTVSMYFPSKLDIALSASDEIAQRLTAVFRDHPVLAFTEVIERWLIEVSESADAQLIAMASAMLQANPGLQAASTAHLAEAAGIGRPALLAEIGLTADDPMVRIVNAVVGTAIAEYFAVPAMNAEEREAFVRYLRTVVTAARPG